MRCLSCNEENPEGVAFEDRDEHELKGIAEPQRLFAVRWREDP